MRGADRARRREGGAVMVLVALAATSLLLFAALAMDSGLVWSTKTQGQNVADSAALAAAATMIDPTGPSVTLGPSRSEAKNFAADNSTVSNPSVTVRDQDIEYGYFDLDTGEFYKQGEEFEPGRNVDLSNPGHVTGARVRVVLDDNVNDESPAFLSGLLGRDGFPVNARATAYLGFDGDWEPGEFELPIAIDSCDLVSDPDGCGSDFCATIANPPNPCPLDDPQAGDGDVTCLEFSSTPEQNACWTQFDGDHPSINNPGLQDIIENGNPRDTQAGDDVFLDNGDKTSTQKDLKDKFEGTGDYAGNPAGTDRYPPFNGPPKSDSWVVKLPVVECQDEAHCAGGEPFKITGGVCFEIREIAGPPTRRIRGRFLCPTDPDPQVRQLYEDHCGDQPGDDPDAPGGCDFGDRAEIVRLVD